MGPTFSILIHCLYSIISLYSYIFLWKLLTLYRSTFSTVPPSLFSLILWETLMPLPIFLYFSNRLNISIPLSRWLGSYKLNHWLCMITLFLSLAECKLQRRRHKKEIDMRRRKLALENSDGWPSCCFVRPMVWEVLNLLVNLSFLKINQ